MLDVDQVFTRATLAILAVLALRLLVGCEDTPEAMEVAADRPAVTLSPSGAIPWRELEPVHQVPVEIADTCDRLIVTDTPTGPQLSKERALWLRDGRQRAEHRDEVRRVVFAVAAELGADELAAEMVYRKAISESSAHAGNVHILSRDVDSNLRAARKGRRRATERWSSARVPVYKRTRKGLRKAGTFDAWAVGRGLYGQVSGLHVHTWSTDAPPWVLCDPVVATVTVFWSMRNGLAECHGTTLRDAMRRFSSGKCAIREDQLERRFDRLARGKVRGLTLEPFDPDAPAVLGSLWPQETADREALLVAVRARLAVVN